MCAFALFGFGARQCRQQVETASEAEPAKVEEWHRELVSSGNRARWRCAERRGGYRVVGGDPLRGRGGGRLAATSDGLQL